MAAGSTSAMQISMPDHGDRRPTQRAPVVHLDKLSFESYRRRHRCCSSSSGDHRIPGRGTRSPRCLPVWRPAERGHRRACASLYGGATLLNTTAGCATTANSDGEEPKGNDRLATSTGVDVRTGGSPQYVGFGPGAVTAIGNAGIRPHGMITPRPVAALGVNWIGNVIYIASGTGFTVQRVQVQFVSQVRAWPRLTRRLAGRRRSPAAARTSAGPWTDSGRFQA